jgi:hypothetical protein
MEKTRAKFEHRLDVTLAKVFADSEHKLRRRKVSDDVLARELANMSSRLSKLRASVMRGAVQ